MKTDRQLKTVWAVKPIYDAHKTFGIELPNDHATDYSTTVPRLCLYPFVYMVFGSLKYITLVSVLVFFFFFW